MKAETTFSLGEKDCVLVYDWDAILLLEEKFGYDKMGDVISSANISQLADIMECGLKRHNPEIKAEDIFNQSPPIVECRKAVDKALALAYFGTTNPIDIAEDGVKKKPRKKAKWFVLISLLSILAYYLLNSGV